MAVHPNCKKVLISNNSGEKEKQASKENGNIESIIHVIIHAKWILRILFFQPVRI